MPVSTSSCSLASLTVWKVLTCRKNVSTDNMWGHPRYTGVSHTYPKDQVRELYPQDHFAESDKGILREEEML